MSSNSEANPSRITLILEPISKRTLIPPGTTVLTALTNLNYPVNAQCGGSGTCGKCKIIANPHESTVSPLNEIEKKKLSAEEQAHYVRLACQTQILADSRIVLTESFLGRNAKILTSGKIPSIPLNPRFWKILLNLNELAPEKQALSDYGRIRLAIQKFAPILNVLNRRIETSYECLKAIPEVIRQKDGRITVTLDSVIGSADEPVILLDVESGNHINDLYGVAIDLGTTTIVGYLIDLRSGSIVAVDSILNPQVAIGEDLMTRLTYVQQNPDGLLRAQTLVKDAIDEMFVRLAEKSKTKTTDIDEIIIAGNTAMHHIFFGLSTNYLGLAPYPPVIQKAVSIRNYHYNFKNLVKNCEIYAPPIVAGFVGSDAVADVIAIRMDQLTENSLLIDIGTNGELVLGNQSTGLVSASVAAGSALEGAHITNGMRGAIGAIEGVTLDPQDWTPHIDVIGNIAPIGICGSGIIDLVAEMLKVGILTRSGRFNVNHPQFKTNPRIRQRNNMWEFIIHSGVTPALMNSGNNGSIKPNNGIVHEIVFTQEDVREVQKAKGAFLSGAKILMADKKQAAGPIEHIYLAGAFGTYIKKENALFIGLIPDIDLNKVDQIGNACGIGAQMLLMNTNIKKQAEEISQQIKYIELAQLESFQGEFARAMHFPHHDLSLFPSLQKQYENIPER
jgi:uncharacterized 2Fe-2S/4Fe-4S cluster protein (DUF4445 family)